MIDRKVSKVSPFWKYFRTRESRISGISEVRTKIGTPSNPLDWIQSTAWGTCRSISHQGTRGNLPSKIITDRALFLIPWRKDSRVSACISSICIQLFVPISVRFLWTLSSQLLSSSRWAIVSISDIRRIVKNYNYADSKRERERKSILFHKNFICQLSFFLLFDFSQLLYRVVHTFCHNSEVFLWNSPYARNGTYRFHYS